MASQAGCKETQLNLDDPDQAEAWILSFAANARIKKLSDLETARDVTDLFLATAGLSAIRTLSLAAAPKLLEDMKFETIKELITATIRPKRRLVIAERIKFLGIKQEQGEKAAAYYRRLRAAAASCDFAELGKKQPIEDDMITMRLIDGLATAEHRRRVLERTQGAEVLLLDILQSLEQLEKIQEYSVAPTQPQQLEIAFARRQSKSNASSKCSYCGGSHAKGSCPAYGKKCASCNRRNHFASVCRSKTVHQESLEPQVSEQEPQKAAGDTHSGASNIFIVSPRAGDRGLFQSVRINGRPLRMQLDTGAEISLIPSNHWELLGRPPLRKTRRILRQFDGSIITCLGEFTATWETESQFHTVDLVVTAAQKSHGLLGMDNLNFDQNPSITTLSASIAAVEQLPHLRGFDAKIKLVDGARPFYCAARAVPIHLQDSVNAELKRMEAEGIIEPVPPGGSEWASPIVCVMKPNGRVRICADFKAGVNHQICGDTYPIPAVETIFADIAGMSYFATIDLSDAYLQIILEESSRPVTTVATPLGLFRYTRLVPGLKSASAIFQKAMESTLSEVKGKVVYQDDILLGGRSRAELDAKVRLTIGTLTSAGMTVNLDKSNLGAAEVSFLGYKISAAGVSPDPRLVERIQAISAPKDRRQLESFLGLCNFFGRFVKNYSSIVEPLNQLRGRNTEFIWGADQDRAFHHLKELLASRPIIRPYDRKKETTLTTDASERAIAAVLTQDGHPVMYFSRRLSEAESRYSNVEREALAIVWAMERARQFLLGTCFSLRTDHRPLEFLFGRRRQLPKVANARLLRWAIRLMGFDFRIEYVKGSEIPHADALSRLNFADNESTERLPEASEEDARIVHWTGGAVLPWRELADETLKERLLVDIAARIEKNCWSNCSPAERPFKAVRHALAIDEGVICYGDRTVIPTSLRRRVLELVHNDSHQGANSTRTQLRNSAWWPGYCGDVEMFVRACPTCARLHPRGQSTVHRGPQENGPWCRVHMDHAHVQGVGLILILVDAMSGWPEAVRVPDRSAATVKRVLQDVFSRNGVPEVLVSDNAAEFHDAKLTGWLERIGCCPIKTPPLHPQSNGIAERMVQSIKKASLGWDRRETYESFLARLLLNYRCIPHAGRPHSPSELMGRQLRNPITMRTPIGSGIWYVPAAGLPPEKAEFLLQKGSNTALIQRGSGRLTLAHQDQIRPLINTEASQSSTEEAQNKAAAPLLRHAGDAAAGLIGGSAERHSADGDDDARTEQAAETAPDVAPDLAPNAELDTTPEPHPTHPGGTGRYPSRSNRGVPPLRFGGGR
ncbi:hypothetical protein BOX15_Mlig030946g1 [Macrostomum lignano]|uniref:RNA-directed DNA polymerase n=1 Tax=Macrostomum lignano TaxID=282301 RepID=A0A267GKL5_9PLAT|nr:hypothetical protein BOX15_Mlig030946g1 [Macrostomum lignano]